MGLFCIAVYIVEFRVKGLHARLPEMSLRESQRMTNTHMCMFESLFYLSLLFVSFIRLVYTYYWTDCAVRTSDMTVAKFVGLEDKYRQAVATVAGVGVSCCTVLQCVVLCCSAFQCVAGRCSM